MTAKVINLIVAEYGDPIIEEDEEGGDYYWRFAGDNELAADTLGELLYAGLLKFDRQVIQIDRGRAGGAGQDRTGE